MTAEKFVGGDGGNLDEYPRGLRVLAVDDDPICLKLLDTLLKKCQYHVTTTNQARVALKMLRESKDRFDLVISDVHMPDMDGFKLLELVGLEMDLPVIMLSANSDPKLVLKGVTHGACDYLVKPVRIEELSNIWQHVIRRRKFDPKSRETKCSSSDHVKKTIPQNGEGHHSSVHENQDVNFNRKRKEDEDDDSEGEDPASQKKPRVVWSMLLHRKFVAAVNKLGYDKAVPKRILDLMNVEGLTRENVASHLQKYRLYLKRISSDAKQAAALNSQFIGPYTSLGDMYFPAPAARLGTSVVPPPYTSGEMLGPVIQTNHARTMTGLGKTVSCLPSMVQSPSLFPGSLNLDQLQTNKHTLDIRNIGGSVDESRIYEASNMLTGQRDATGCSSGVRNNHSSLNLACSNPAGFGVSDAAEPSRMQQPSSLISDDPFRSQLPSMNSKGDNVFSTSSYLLNAAQPTRWGYDRGSNAVGPSNSYDIGILSRNTNFSTNHRPVSGSSNLMQQNVSKSMATESGAMTNDTFPLARTNDELITCGYDPFDEMVNAMIKREDDDALLLPRCDFGFDDFSFGL